MGQETSNFLYNPFNSSTIHVAIQSGLLNSVLLTKCVYAFCISPVLATHLSHLILLNFVTLILFGEELEVLLLVFRYLCVCAQSPSPCRWRAALAR